MKKHIHTIMTSVGLIIFLLTLTEIIDMFWEKTWGEGFINSLYYWFIWVGVLMSFYGVIGKVDKIEKKIDSKTDEKPM